MPAVMHLGVDLPSEAEIPASPGPRNTILCPANLYPVKGHRYLIEAIALLRDAGSSASCSWPASGELRAELEAQVQNLGLADAVQFLGQRSHSEILAMYREGRVGMVVLPSVDLGNNLHEGIPGRADRGHVVRHSRRRHAIPAAFPNCWKAARA